MVRSKDRLTLASAWCSILAERSLGAKPEGVLASELVPSAVEPERVPWEGLQLEEL